MFDVIATLLLLAAGFSFFNERFLHLQSTIALMLLALIFSLIILSLPWFGIDLSKNHLLYNLAHIDFSQVVLNGVLCFLLFAGALNVPFNALKRKRWDIITLAIIGTIVATFVIGSLCWLALNTAGIPLPYLYALLFGAIVSPTDPIAALSILKSIGLPENLEVVIDGESQFNDGVGVVIFTTLSSIIVGESNPQISHIVLLFSQEVLGGIGLGLTVAFMTHIMLRGSHVIVTQVLITLSAVTINYALAEKFGFSGPIASVVLGLIVGNFSMKAIAFESQDHMNTFWDLVNQVLNAILFVLIGLEALIIKLPEPSLLLIASIAILTVLTGRYISVVVSMYLLDIQKKFNLTSRTKLARFFTWTGLRGALAIALVLSLPEGHIKTLLLPMTYAVVVFSILIQGNTISLFFSSDTLKKLVLP